MSGWVGLYGRPLGGDGQDVQYDEAFPLIANDKGVTHAYTG